MNKKEIQAAMEAGQVVEHRTRWGQPVSGVIIAANAVEIGKAPRKWAPVDRQRFPKRDGGTTYYREVEGGPDHLFRSTAGIVYAVHSRDIYPLPDPEVMERERQRKAEQRARVQAARERTHADRTSLPADLNATMHNIDTRRVIVNMDALLALLEGKA